MITPGQKLQDGDFFKGGTNEQYKELLVIENFPGTNYHRHCFTDGGITCVKGWIFDLELVALKDGRTNLKTEYSFPDFKQLCENTFGNGNT